MAVARQLQPTYDASDIHAGMEVFGIDGEKIGTVTEVWVNVPGYGHQAKSAFEMADYGPVRGTVHLMTGSDGYLQVGSGRVIRREGEQPLLIPLDAVRDAVEGESVTIDHSRDTVASRFGRPPITR